jgi:hypothetical protein
MWQEIGHVKGGIDEERKSVRSMDIELKGVLKGVKAVPMDVPLSDNVEELKKAVSMDNH